jgi:hypothetical protein
MVKHFYKSRWPTLYIQKRFDLFLPGCQMRAQNSSWKTRALSYSGQKELSLSLIKDLKGATKELGEMAL